MKNDYEIRGDVTVIKVISRKFGLLDVLISTEKLCLVNEFPNTWCAGNRNGKCDLYIFGLIRNKGKSNYTALHRWIMSAPKGKEVDHINHDTLNNTDENLRIVSVSENQQNRKGASSRSASGIRNVYWHKASKKWSVELRIGKVKMTFGNFTDIKEAELTAIEARRKYMPFSEEIGA